MTIFNFGTRDSQSRQAYSPEVPIYLFIQYSLNILRNKQKKSVAYKRIFHICIDNSGTQRNEKYSDNITANRNNRSWYLGKEFAMTSI